MDIFVHMKRRWKTWKFYPKFREVFPKGRVRQESSKIFWISLSHAGHLRQPISKNRGRILEKVNQKIQPLSRIGLEETQE